MRKKPDRMEPEWVQLPRDLYEHHINVTLTADVMFVNGIAFLTTLSRDIRLRTIEFVPSHTAAQLGRSLMKIVTLYTRGGFIVRITLMDMEF